MAEGAIAILVKTPGFSPVKTRLAKRLSQDLAEEFHRLSSTAVAEVASGSGLTPYWAVAEEEALGSWKHFPAIHQGSGGLGSRLHHVYSSLLARHSFVLLVGADSPQMQVPQLNAAAEICRGGDFAFGPSRDGGFYLFGGSRKIDRDLWERVPYSEATTGAKFLECISPLGRVRELPVLGDVDEFEDLERLKQDLEVAQPLLAGQSKLLQWIGKVAV